MIIIFNKYQLNFTSLTIFVAEKICRLLAFKYIYLYVYVHVFYSGLLKSRIDITSIFWGVVILNTQCYLKVLAAWPHLIYFVFNTWFSNLPCYWFIFYTLTLSPYLTHHSFHLSWHNIYLQIGTIESSSKDNEAPHGTIWTFKTLEILTKNS